MRTQDEILARIKEVEAHDMFGFETSDLVGALDFEHAKPYLKEGVTADDEWLEESEDELRDRAVKYLEFAYDKAESHRGLSAGRSVAHYTSWLWLLGVLPDDWDDVPYENYGVPKLFRAAEALGQTLPHDRKRLTTMGSGRPCTWDCEEGCSS